LFSKSGGFYSISPSVTPDFQKQAFPYFVQLLAGERRGGCFRGGVFFCLPYFVLLNHNSNIPPFLMLSSAYCLLALRLIAEG